MSPSSVLGNRNLYSGTKFFKFLKTLSYTEFAINCDWIKTKIYANEVFGLNFYFL